MQSGRADAHILAAILGLSAIGKNPSLGSYHLLTGPAGGAAELPRHPARAGYALRRRRSMRGSTSTAAPAQIREWLLDGLAKFGVTREQVPATLSF